MDDLVAQAKRLAEMLAGHERTKALREASAAVTEDADAKKLEEEYAHAASEMAELEASGSPIEPDVKRRMAALGERIRRSPLLQRLLQANADFADMMDGVQHEISDAVGRALAPDPDVAGEHVHGPGCAHDAPRGREEPRRPEEPGAKSGPILWTP
jgi:cell fate (sporulation/competence/biofilm development) regulator YlbF (YheA/YmcA/DUF963 family)